MRGALKRHARFGGRARRRELALFALVVAVVFAAIVGSTLGYATLAERSPGVWPLERNEGWLMLMLLLVFLFGAIVLVPSFALGVRRLHDIDRTGWWALIPAAVLVVGPLGAGSVVELIFAGLRAAVLLFLLVLLCLPGTSGANRYGPDPRDPAEALA